ncbi:MAG TPA: hypothetical protein GX701_07615 [Clostridiales bacterium]|nr:hypothetical protein [Clostridiales bacterium]
MHYHREQTHVHEVLGSVRLAGPRERIHDHRFARALRKRLSPCPAGIFTDFSTDFTKGHFHPICVETGLQVPVGTGKDRRHVHFIYARTECEAGHLHDFIAATLIENPVGD